MKKLLLEIFLGLLGIFGGIYLGYMYLKSLDQNSNPLFLVLSIVLLGIGIFFLLRTSKSDASVIAKMKDPIAPTQKAGLENIVKRNNDLSNEWGKTLESKTRLQTLELAASSENSK